MTNKTEKQLNEMIDDLKQKLEAEEERANTADGELENLKNQIADGRDTWAQPVKWDEDDALPIPRLELYWESLTEDGYEARCSYMLVTRHLLGHVLAHPLGSTTSNGRSAELKWMYGNEIDIPFRDGAHAFHDAKQLKLPLYVTTESGDVDEIRLDADGRRAGSRVVRRA